VLYSDILLNSCKLAQLVDDDAETLTNAEVQKWFDYLKYAIAKFNNNPKVSIGTEKFIATDWLADAMGPFIRIVRDPDLSHLYSIAGGNPPIESQYNATSSQPFLDFPNWSNNQYASANPISTLHEGPERGIKRRPWQFTEIPQRIISAGELQGSNLWNVVNMRDFFSASQNDRVISYELLSENEAILRARFPHPLFILFDRAIPYSFGLDDLKANLGSSMPEASQMPEGFLFDLIGIYVDFPTTHIPYLMAMTAVEIAVGQKQDADIIAQLKDQMNSQEKDLMAQNVRDRVKTDHILRDDSWSFWNRRAFR